MAHNFSFPSIVQLLILAASSVIVTNASAQTERTLYRFQNRSDGGVPHAHLVADAAGNLYGTSCGYNFPPHFINYGSVFELTPSGAWPGSWIESTLYTFTGGSDGACPVAGLVWDKAGNLYGTTLQGGVNDCGVSGCGVVFQLSRPATPDDVWTETVLYSFSDAANDGWDSWGGVTFDKRGNLVGTTYSGGVTGAGIAFQLTPPPQPGGSWTETVIHDFGSGLDGYWPMAYLTLGKNGALYGTTNGGGPCGGGTVFELSPLPTTSGDSWTERVIYSFGCGPYEGLYPYGGLTFGGSGSELSGSELYGTTSLTGTYGKGVVFRLTPSQNGTWTEDVLFRFDSVDGLSEPMAEVIFDEAGNLYGTTVVGGAFGFGGVFQLKPPTGGGEWSESTLHSFAGIQDDDGAEPRSGLVILNGALYGTTTEGGIHSCKDGEHVYGCGTVFEIVP